jgi:hypothetical protein
VQPDRAKTVFSDPRGGRRRIVQAAVLLGSLLVIGAVGLPIVLRHLPPHEESPTVREERLAREQACMAAIFWWSRSLPPQSSHLK